MSANCSLIMTDKELKKQFESERNQPRFALTGVGFLAVGGLVLLVLLLDPFGGSTEPLLCMRPRNG